MSSDSIKRGAAIGTRAKMMLVVPMTAAFLFLAPGAYAASVTTSVQGSYTPVAPGSLKTITVSCPNGSMAFNGGWLDQWAPVKIYASVPWGSYPGPNGWQVTAYNSSSTQTLYVTAYAICGSGLPSGSSGWAPETSSSVDPYQAKAITTLACSGGIAVGGGFMIGNGSPGAPYNSSPTGVLQSVNIFGTGLASTTQFMVGAYNPTPYTVVVSAYTQCLSTWGSTTVSQLATNYSGGPGSQGVNCPVNTIATGGGFWQTSSLATPLNVFFNGSKATVGEEGGYMNGWEVWAMQPLPSFTALGFCATIS